MVRVCDIRIMEESRSESGSGFGSVALPREGRWDIFGAVFIDYWVFGIAVREAGF